MIDLERELVTALRDYADSITPSAPPSIDPVVATVDDTPQGAPRRNWWVAAAVLLVVGVIAGLVVLRDRGDGVKPTDTTVPSLGTWTTLPESPLSPRKTPSVVWTGTEFIVWGGSDGNPHGLSDGAAFDPATGHWRTIAPTSAAHPGANAVWAGDRMVVLAGLGGQAYDPVTDTWSALPALQPGPLSKGFTDAVWTAGQLLGVGVDKSDSSDSAVLTAWRLDSTADRWVELAQITATTAVGFGGRFVSQADQFFVYDPIATDSGFALWGTDGGWQFSLASGPDPASGGWAVVQPVDAPEGKIIQGTSVVWRDGLLTAVVATSPSDELALSWRTNGAWTTPQPALPGTLGLGRALAIDRGVVVVGPFLARSTPGAPALLWPDRPGAVLEGYPLDTVIDQGAAWSGEQLFIWGGQRSTGGGEQTTDDPGPISSAGALWTPGD